MQRPKLESNRSQFGCELGLCGELPDGPRKRNFEARDFGEIGAYCRPERRAKTALVPIVQPLTSGNFEKFGAAVKDWRNRVLGGWSSKESNC